MSTIPYAVCCKSCGHIESTAYYGPNDERNGQPMRDAHGQLVPLTPQGRVPVYCLKCGAQNWRVPATAEDVAKHDATGRRQARAVELCKGLDLDGLFKVPEEIRATAEVKNALSNLFAPLEGEALKLAQQNCLRVAKAGIAVPAETWVELYDKAVTKALEAVSTAKKGAKVA